MKKLISLLLCMCLLATLLGTALAEPFNLRNGILFGDTLSDVLAKEQTLTRQDEKTDTTWFQGKISDWDNALCRFDFNSDGKLSAMLYEFDDTICTSDEQMQAVYDTLTDKLTAKYGKPLGNTDGKVHLMTGPAFNYMGLVVSIFSSMGEGFSGNWVKYDEWDVEANDGWVKIDIISFYWAEPDGTKHDYVCLSYFYYTLEDAIDAMRAKEEN